MIDSNRLAAMAAEYEIELSPQMLEQYRAYAALLAEWNQKVNLTAITDPRQVEIKHFLDCLLLAKQPWVAQSLVDVGTGAGFPGVVVKVFRPEVALTLMEPNGKRQAFLGALLTTLGLQATLVKERAEEAAKKQWREQFAVATARAVAPLNILCEYCLPLVKPGGTFVAMKSAEEEAIPENALQKLGGRHLQTQLFQLPDGSGRSLIRFEKIAPTPPLYPRNGGVIAKRPL